ncbi:GNAT family N-acetyltransferase [archaeon]|nr:GNAT family N-acetyltransferase [archaeon]
MELVFKRAIDSDWQKIAELEQSVSTNKYYHSVTTESEVKKYMKESQVYLIYDEKEAVGTVSFEMKTPKHAYLDGLTVRPDYQKQGVATKAIEFILNKLKGIDRIELVTHPENTPAIKVYLRFDFTIEAWKDNYFGDGEPRILLARKGLPF